MTVASRSNHLVGFREAPTTAGGAGAVRTGSSHRGLHALLLFVIWVSSAAYAWHGLDQGWFPHDEGALAQSAERVLHGELPHRDFDEIYTGGLSFVNALVFRLFGTNLMSLRLVLFGLFLLWVPSVYYVATRFATPVMAALVTLLAVAWSIPNYSAAVPSWFNLYFAVFALAALLRFLETKGRTWLFLAGLCAGLSVLAKIAGVYLIVGILLTLSFFEQTEDALVRPAASRTYSILLTVAAIVLVGALVLLVQKSPAPANFFHFVFPGSAIAACLVWREWQRRGGPASSRIRRLLSYAVPFGAGVIVPILAFLVPYLLSSSVGDLLRGVFLIPARRFEYASWPMPPLWTLLFAVPLAWLLLAVNFRSRRRSLLAFVLVGAMLGGSLLGAGKAVVAAMVWASMRPLIPLAALGGVYFLMKAGYPEERNRALLAVTAIASMASLVQFPWSQPMYFIYVAPLAALALTAVVSFRPVATPFLSIFFVFYLLFAVSWLNSGIYSGADPHPRHLLTDRLDLPRGGLRVFHREAQEYENLVSLVREHATGDYILATPDCPEVYFLTGLRNPTRWTFEFLQTSPVTTNRLLQTLKERGVSVVVINENPRFSDPLSENLRTALRALFPESSQLGKFTVRWAT